MNEAMAVADIASRIGIIAEGLGLLALVAKGGQYKGRLDKSIEAINTNIQRLVCDLEATNGRVDGVELRVNSIEKELLTAVISLSKDVEYIKESIDRIEKNGAPNASAQ